MKKSLLSLALIAALGAASGSGVASPSTSGAISDIRFLQLSDIPGVLSSNQGEAPPPKNDISTGTEPTIAWVPSSAPSTPKAREAIADLALSGMGILVSIDPQVPRYDAATFGAETDGAIVLYQRLADGTLDIYSSPLGEGKAPMEHWQKITSHARDALAKSRRIRAANPKEEDLTGPVMRFNKTEFSPINHNASSSLEIRVTRDSGPNRDSKIITVKHKAIATPYRNGATACKWPTDTSTCSFTKNGGGWSLLAPLSYTVNTMLAWPKKEDPQAQRIEYYPTGTSETDMKISHSVSTTRSFDWGVSPEVAAGLAKDKEKPADYAGKMSPKIGFNIGGGWTKTEKDSIDMTVQDYSVKVAGKHVDTVLWMYEKADIHKTIFSLSPLLYSVERFRSGSGVSTSNMTPMMFTANLETLTRWKVRGDYEGTLKILGTTAIDNMVWTTSPSMRIGTEPDGRLKNDGYRPPINPHFPTATQPVSELTIDLGAPYLTRTPTVMIQTKAADSMCLMGSSSGAVRVIPCVKDPGNREQQWNIDPHGRYVNRETQQCLTISSGGYASTAPCQHKLSQKWEWRADRIHSLVGDGTVRLYTDGSLLVYAGNSPSEHDPIPVNPIHAELKPWSSYPLKPRSYDMIYGFGREVPLPARYLDFREVPASQRWATIPFIFGLN